VRLPNLAASKCPSDVGKNRAGIHLPRPRLFGIGRSAEHPPLGVRRSVESPIYK
jgi:hypothetical protein